jgi:uncharacterized protein YaiL (DUF2058 family)
MTTQEYKDRLKKENKKELIEMLGVAYENANKNYEVQLDTEKVKKLYQKEKNKAELFLIGALALASTTILTAVLYMIK